VHYYRDRNRDDSRHQYSRSDRLSSTGQGTWASSRERERRSSDHRRDRDGSRNIDNRRGRNDPGERQASNRSGTSATPDSNTIRFRSRDTRARADAERRRTRAAEDLNRPATRRTSFAPSPRRGSGGSANRRTGSRPSAGPAQDRRRTVAMNNPGRQAAPSPPRQSRSAAPTTRAPRASNQGTSRRSQPQRNAPQRSATAPTPSRSSSGSSRRAESRSSGSRSSSGRRDGGQRRRH
jgi:hypothetical protein